MKPKEKAIEIFNSMYEVYNMEQYPDFTIEYDDNKKNDELWETNRDLFNNIYNEFAKRCALIAVDEILKSEPLEPNNIPEWLQPEDWFSEANKSAGDYWVEVKKEIEAL